MLPVSLLDGFDDVLIGPVPVRPLAVGHDLPADDAEAPHVRRRGELAEGDGLRRRPPHRNFAALSSTEKREASVSDVVSRQREPVEADEKEWNARRYPSGVGALCCALDLAAQSEIGDLADELRVDEDVAGGQVAVDVVHLAEVLHAEGDAAQHAQQLQHLELAVVGLRTRRIRSAQSITSRPDPVSRSTKHKVQRETKPNTAQGHVRGGKCRASRSPCTR